MHEDGAQAAVLDRISTGVVEVLGELFHSNPSDVKTCWQDDLVVCLLYGAFSPAEQTMIAEGVGVAVLHQRHATQELQRKQLVAVVEAATRQKVVGFMSGNQINGLVCEMFVLETDGSAFDQRFHLRLT